MSQVLPRAQPQSDGTDPKEHYPGQGGPEPYVRLCPFCKKDLTGFCKVLKTPAGQPVLVSEPVKCKFCGRYLLFGEKESPILRPR